MPDFVGSVVLGDPAVPDGVFGDIVPDVPEPEPLPIALPDVDEPLEPVLPDPIEPLGELIEPVVPAGVPDPASDDDPPVEPLVPLLIAPPEPDVDAEPLASLPVDGVLGEEVVAVLPVPAVPDVLDGFDIELSVFGASALLQAPSAAKVAAMATHLIERCMFAPRWWNGVTERAPPVPPAASA